MPLRALPLRFFNPARVVRALLALLAAALLLLGLDSVARAQPVQPVPALSGRVVDATGTLSAAEAAALDARLAAIEQKNGSQVVILMVSSTAPEDIASYANRVANAWKIGRRQVGDGVLVVVALKDRRLRIEVAKSLEGALPDLAASRIIDQQITPSFKQGRYAAGLMAGVDAIGSRIAADDSLLAQGAAGGEGSNADSGDFGLFELGVFMLVAVPILGAILRDMFGRRLGSLLTSGAVGGLAFWLTASLLIAVGAGLLALFIALLSGTSLPMSQAGGANRGGWTIGPDSGGFGGGGGGWGSGGGGDFGGGGASGSW